MRQYWGITVTVKVHYFFKTGGRRGGAKILVVQAILSFKKRLRSIINIRQGNPHIK